MIRIFAGMLSVAALPAAVAAEQARTADRALDNVTVTGQRVREREVEPTRETEKLLELPGSMGDPMQAVYSLPGVISTQEIGGVPAVRGSSPDDNGFLIDFLPASYVFHDFGFSIFHENLIRDFGLKSAGFGSRYGRATGAIFDVSLREPRLQPWSYTFDSSFLRLSAMAEGQITDTQAAYVSVRESLLHLVLKLRADAIEDEEDIRFTKYPRARDFQLKYSWTPNEQNRVTFLGVGAQDITAVRLGNESDIALIDPGVTGEAELRTGFISEGVRWLYDDETNRLQTAVGHLKESRDLSSGDNTEFSNTDNSLITFKSHYDRNVGDRHTIGLGGEFQQAQYDYDLRFRYRSCTNFTPDCRTNRGPLIAMRDGIDVNSVEAFLEDRWNVFDPLTLTVGAHYSQNDYLDESHVDPRTAAELKIDSQWTASASWGKYHQLPRIGQIIPVLGNPLLDSPSATHYVLGLKQVLNPIWSWNAEAYYKELSNVVVDVTTGQQYVNGATGEAYGLDLMINKNRDEFGAIEGWNRVYGWITLSASKAKRHNDVNGVASLFEYDTPIIANFVVNYRLNASWDIGARWQFHSGLPYTPIVGNTPNPNFPGFYLPIYGGLNSSRATPYHRLDLRGEYQLKLRAFKGSVYFDVINAYAKRNGGAVQYKPKPNSPDYELEEQDTLPLLPSVGVKVTF